jgi:hypothetical protein
MARTYLAAKGRKKHKEKNVLRPLQKERSGFWQKAELFNFKRFAALCRDAATADDQFYRSLVPCRLRFFAADFFVSFVFFMVNCSA